MKTYLICNAILLLCGIAGVISSCEVGNMAPIANTATLPGKLSDYGIFPDGAIERPAAGFHRYHLATQLFTDYAEKQRLIHLPRGAQFSFDSSGNAVFPDSSILVKTFFYYPDKRKPSAGKQLIETRLLVKINGQWNVGTYKWNKEQTEAYLLENGTDENVSWVNEHGLRKTLQYRIPAQEECSSCHRTGRSITPIGPKARNLNLPLADHPHQENQLLHFEQTGLLTLQPSDLLAPLPDWQSPSIPLAERARAYLDVNCAHCHSATGFAESTRLFFGYEIPLANTRIRARKDHILHRVEATDPDIRMPQLGTTVPDSVGVALIRAYIQSL
ncbi:hypothetical protein [Dyadobacter jiangsuensis]|uniref:Putative repeat protein (TIGR03806 family) n=1 Tax=Dyadobacter jiangsuensis TaxID=1591085 RepID=A0A2P8GIX5_9BACT|nr:hypothetical protein [Dyadobacter jiangsuensis]PSL33880.1 putative repeat protein (TIGR03806 family) [Dyadobacter jiangsuensis]